jgi:uncharacterized protein (DUF2249 family)
MSEHATITHPTNHAVADAIRTHHDELSAQLRERTSVLLAAIRSGDADAARDQLHQWYQTELLPHAVAEEATLYAAGADLDATRLLVQGMLAEHRALVSLIAQLALAEDPLDTVAAATSAQHLFTVHLAKENDLLLPALDQAGLDLAPLLAGMHELLGHDDQPAAEPADAGCGCGHDHGAGSVAVPLVQAPTAAGNSEELDVRSLPHGRRHEIIFARLDALAAGQSLTIVNDHDPKPLRYQTSTIWPDRFTWTYRDAGPRVWRVAITCAH